MWACLAAMSVYCEDLNTAEVAYAALENTAQVLNICRIKEITNEDSQKAEISLFKKDYKRAESILLSKNLIYRALFMWVELYQWDKALELGLKFRQYLDILLFYRSKYLNAFGLRETNVKFIELGEKLHFEEDLVKQKILREVGLV